MISEFGCLALQHPNIEACTMIDWVSKVKYVLFLPKFCSVSPQRGSINFRVTIRTRNTNRGYWCMKASGKRRTMYISHLELRAQFGLFCASKARRAALINRESRQQHAFYHLIPPRTHALLPACCVAIRLTHDL